MSASGKVRRWSYRCLLAIELILVLLLLAGGCYSKQDYHVLSGQLGDEFLSKCNVVVDARVVNVKPKYPTKWQNLIFFCWPRIEEEPESPDRYDISIEVDTIVRGDPNTPRRMVVKNCRPLTGDEANRFALSSQAFPESVPVRIGWEHRHFSSYTNLVVVPLPNAPTTQP